MRLRALISFALVAAVSACAESGTIPRFDGLQFGGRLQADREDRRAFTAQVAPVSQSLAGAREAARHEGTVYCVRNYGSSDIEWISDPDADENALQIEDDRLFVSGRCAE
jgi:hypothetical protein